MNNSRCFYYMTCCDNTCNKIHSDNNINNRIYLFGLIGYYKKLQISVESPHNRKIPCIFSGICLNHNCGYYHSGLKYKTRVKLYFDWNYYLDMKENEEVDNLLEEAITCSYRD